MSKSVKELEVAIKAIQEKCKHVFVSKRGLAETKIKNVFSGFYLSAEHTQSHDCTIVEKMIAAQCTNCELRIKFKPTERCPKCLTEMKKIEEEKDLARYFNDDDYNDYTCRCLVTRYTAFLYQCKNHDCCYGVINLEYDYDKSSKVHKARSELRQYSLG